MTALDKYSRLETTGLWRPDPEAQRREVLVSFGDASIVLSDERTEVALSHWSLPAIERRNFGELPAIYAPGPEQGGETLEIDDPSMIEAIETVRGALAKRRPRKGALRLTMVATTLMGIAALGLWWLPAALVAHTGTAIPFVKRQEIGTTLLSSMQRYTGAPCTTVDGTRALDALAVRLFPGSGAQIIVLRDGLPEGESVTLPGRIHLIDHALVESHDGPEVLAGHLIAGAARAERKDPLAVVLHDAGLRATFTLLSTGSLPEAALEPQARARLRPDTTALDSADLAQRLASAGVNAAPYAQSLGTEGRALAAAASAAPDEGRRLMPDADWLALQSICAR